MNRKTIVRAGVALAILISAVVGAANAHSTSATGRPAGGNGTAVP